MRVLVTGGTGYLGSALLRRLSDDAAWQLRAAVRPGRSILSLTACEAVTAEDLSVNTAWQDAVSGCDAVVHAAGRVHVMQETSPDALAEFRRVNVQGTLNLARQAARAGAKRFVYVSSIKVNGERTAAGVAFGADDAPNPLDAYSVSKLEAELGLRTLAAETGMEVVIIRPPLIYGPGVGANFLALLRAVARGFPLPLGAIDNRRSLVAIDNAVDLIVNCLKHPQAANETFLVSDGEDLSTADLVRRMACAMHKPARLVPAPPWMLHAAATLLGKQDAVHRLCWSLQVDISKTVALLGWRPPVSVDEGLRKAVAGMIRTYETTA